jgi:hypothetical protein
VAHQCCWLAPGDLICAQLACPLNDIIFVYIRNNQPISLQTLVAPTILNFKSVLMVF